MSEPKVRATALPSVDWAAVAADGPTETPSDSGSSERSSTIPAEPPESRMEDEAAARRRRRLLVLGTVVSGTAALVLLGVLLYRWISTPTELPAVAQGTEPAEATNKEPTDTRKTEPAPDGGNPPAGVPEVPAVGGQASQSRMLVTVPGGQAVVMAFAAHRLSRTHRSWPPNLPGHGDEPVGAQRILHGTSRRHCTVGGLVRRWGAAASGPKQLDDALRRQHRQDHQDLRPPQPAILAAVLSPDGRHVLSTAGGHSTSAGAKSRSDVCVWDVETGQQVRHYEGPQGQMDAVAFSADGKAVFAAGTTDDPACYAWDVDKEKGRRNAPRGRGVRQSGFLP